MAQLIAFWLRLTKSKAIVLIDDLEYISVHAPESALIVEDVNAYFYFIQ